MPRRSFNSLCLLIAVAVPLVASAREWPLFQGDLPGMGLVRCKGVTSKPKDYRRTIRCIGPSGEVLENLPIGEPIEWTKNGIELQPRSILGLPEPLLVAVAASPHGSTTNWQIVLMGVVGGKLRTLSKEPFEVYSESGFFVGDLGGERGAGVAIWEFLWDDCHMCPSRYAVHFYPWNQDAGEFAATPTSTIVTKERFATGIEAIHSLGLPYVNMLRDFKLLDRYW